MRRIGSKSTMKPRGGSQRSFYKQCSSDRVALDVLTNNAFDSADEYDQHEFDVKEVEDGDMSFHFDHIMGNDNIDTDKLTFGDENPNLDHSTPTDSRHLSVGGPGEMSCGALTQHYNFSECSSSASSGMGIKHKNHQLLKHLSGCASNILALHSCNNNRGLGKNLLVASGADGSILVWNSVLHTLVYYLTGHFHPVHALLITPKEEMLGNHLLSGCNGGQIILWDLDTGLQMRTFGFATEDTTCASKSDGVTCLAIRKHSECKKKMMLVIAGYMGGGIHIWDFETNVLIFSLQGHDNVVNAVSIIEKNSKRTQKEDDFFIVSCSQDSTVHMYDMQENKEKMSTKIKELYHSKISTLFSKKKADFNPKLKSQSSKSFYHIATEESLRSLEDEDHGLLAPVRVLRGHEGGVRKCIIRPKQSFRNEGYYIISCSDDCTVRYFDVESETEVRVLRGHTHKVSDICAREVDLTPTALESHCSHQNFMLITASLDRTVVIWDGISGEALRCLLGHGDEVYSLCLVEKESGKFDIVSGGGEGEVILWNIDCQEDVSNILLMDHVDTRGPKKDRFSEEAANMYEFKKSFHDRKLISIYKRTSQQSSGDGDDDDDSFNDQTVANEESLFIFVSCRYGSNTIQVHEGDCRRNMKISRDIKVSCTAEEKYNEKATVLRITALSTMCVRGEGRVEESVYYILAGLSSGDIHMLDCSDGRLIKKLSDGDAANTNHGHENHVTKASVVAISVREFSVKRMSDSKCTHVVAARNNGAIVIWNFEAEGEGGVCSNFRDYDEDVSCLALLEVNFSLLDNLNDGGFRFARDSSEQSKFDFAIVTGSTSGMIKIWKYNSFGGGWTQCFEISTAVEDVNHGGCGISSVRVLWNELTPWGQDGSIRSLCQFQLVAGYLDGSINIWDIETKTITMVLDEKQDFDVSFQMSISDFAVMDLCVTKKIDGYEIISVRNNKEVMLWRNIDINNIPGYGALRELVKEKKWFSLHVLYKRFGWMLFNAWQSNAETLFIFTLLVLKNRHISNLIENVCVYNNPDPRSITIEDVNKKYSPSYCWLGVKTRRSGRSILRTCVEKRVYNDIKFTLDAWCQVLNSGNIDLFDELQDSFHYHLAQEDLILVAEEYSPLFCDFIKNISSQKSHEWILGTRVRDKFRKRENNMKMKSFDRWYQKKYLESHKKKKVVSDGGITEEAVVDTSSSFWDSDHNPHDNRAILDIIDADGPSIISIYELLEQESEYRASIVDDPTKASCFQVLTARLFQSIRTNLGTTMDKRKARSQVLIEGRFMPLRSTLCDNLLFLRACLNTQNVEIFDTEVLNLTVDYAWRAYGRRGHTEHFITFLCFLFFAAIATFNFESLLANDKTYLYFISSYGAAMSLQITLGLSLIYLFYLEVVAVVTDATMTNILEALIFYFADVWNIVDLTSYSFNILGVAIRLFKEKDTNISKIAFAISSVLMWLKLLYYLRAFKSTGPLVSMILQILFESRFFLLILCIALFGFAQAFLVMGLYGTVGTSLLQVFVMMLGEFDLEFKDTANEPITTGFFILFMVIVTVVFLNLLIAIMGDSYDRIKEKEIAQWRRQQAKSIVDETLLITDGKKKNKKSRTWFPSTIHILRPLNNFGNTQDGTEWQGKVSQLKRVITENFDVVKKESEKRNYRIDILGRSVCGVDEATKKMEGKLSQKVEALSERVNELTTKMELILDKVK